MGRTQRVSRPALSSEQVEDARIREMAARIRDEPHWRSILDACASPEDRASLEAHVGPLLAFRHCGNKACDSAEPPVWAPVLLVREFAGAPTDRITVLLRVCHVCREKITLADVLTDETWDRIRDHYDAQRRTRPIRSLTTLTFDALQ